MEPDAVSPERASAHGHPLVGHAAHLEKFLRPFRRVGCRQVGHMILGIVKSCFLDVGYRHCDVSCYRHCCILCVLAQLRD
jgi:hypothetical protein